MDAARDATVQIDLGRGGHDEPPLQVRQELLLQESIRARQITDARQPQGFDQPVLKHRVPTLDAALGLRAVRKDELDVQFLHRPTKLR